VRADLDREARARRSEVRWVRLEGVHVTLRFLGATDPARVEAIGDAVERAARGHGRFRTVVAGAGAFPSASRPRTLWLGLTSGRDELAALAASLDGELAALGWPLPDRPFRPHLTLGRADGRREGPRAAQLLHHRAANVEIPFGVDRLVLFESVTGGGRARYVPIREASLGA
jgi:2'-5' RNA ligase